jgi:hypothetical protein
MLQFTRFYEGIEVYEFLQITGGGGRGSTADSLVVSST